MAALPTMTVTFDDGTVVTVVPKTRDMVGAEAAGHDFTSGGGAVRGMWATAFAGLQRMSRAGSLPDGLELPGSLAEFIDLADVEALNDDEDPEGKG